MQSNTENYQRAINSLIRQQSNILGMKSYSPRILSPTFSLRGSETGSSSTRSRGLLPSIHSSRRSPTFMHQKFSIPVRDLYFRDTSPVSLPTTKLCEKKFGVVKGYAVNTHSGLVKDYNEDRVSITLKLHPPEFRRHEQWPECSYFGLFDGHGGKFCSGFLRDNLHKFLVKEESFPTQPQAALFRAFAEAENCFLQSGDNSGSCGLVVVIVGDQCFIANLGDSRALLGTQQGKKILPLTKDHKPNEPEEKKRVELAGGAVYNEDGACFRVSPGGLAVSRCFGDSHIKTKINAVIAIPEVSSFRIKDEHDFILMASDGIFDVIENYEIMHCVRRSMHEGSFAKTAVRAVEDIFHAAFRRRTTDNVTVLLVAFKGLKRQAKLKYK